MYKKPFFLNAAHAQSVRQDGITDKVLFWECLSVKISRNWLPLRIPVRAEAKVDKNRAKCLNLVYRLPKMVRASPKVDQKLEK